jgi:S1-C subfamily serine protease
MERRRNPTLLLLGVVALLVIAGACAVGAILLLRPAPGPAPATPPVAVTPRGDLSAAEQSTIELFRQAAPSVVFITTVSLQRDPFRLDPREVPEGSGSGFLWDAQGHVVTNFHVIRNADGARVTLADQSVWPARLVGFVAEKDLAVLRIEAPGVALRPLPMGTSHDLLVGQHVFAIGNPFGLDHTLSTGVISGLDRQIESTTQRPITGVIQTDAAINPGNSGGPLLDSAGRLIGVNTAIFSPSGASAGIGFAVPVDTVRRIVPQLIAHGRVVRPGLGVQLAPPDMLRRLGIEGVLILGVQPGSPAAQAGLQGSSRAPLGNRMRLGDIVVAADGETVRGEDDLFRILDRSEVGQTLTLTVRRGDQPVEVPVVLGAFQAQ